MSSVLPTPASCIKGLPSLHKAPVPRRLVLKDAQEDLQERLTEERKAHELVAKRTAAVRERIARLEGLAAELQQARETHNGYVQTKAEEAKAQRKLPSGLGMMTFRTGGFGEGNPAKPAKAAGRASRRTAFTTDYKGEHHLGESEWVHKWEIQNRAEQEILRREQRRDDLKRSATAEPPETSPPSPQPTASRTPGLHLSSSATPGLDKHQMRPAGVGGREGENRLRSNGLPTLATAQHCSSRRTRFYVNYEGKRIMMDPCDWPEEHDFVLIGT